MKPRWFLEAAGLALLVIMPFVADLLIPGGTFLLHTYRNLLTIVLGIGIDVIAVMLLAFLVLFLVNRLEPMTRSIVVGMAAGSTLWWLLCCMVTGLLLLPSTGILFHIDPMLKRIETILLSLGFTFPMFAAVLVLLRPHAISALARALRLGLAAFSLNWIWILPHLIYLATLKPVSGFDFSADRLPSNGSSRIVWILMDELSYDLIFDNPVSRAGYPNFDRFRSTSFSFNHVVPVGHETDEIVPALLSGHTFAGVESKSNGDLMVLDPQSRAWRPFDQQGTLFALARDYGWSPGFAGWYNPPCRTFQYVLTACSWQPGIQDRLPLQRLGASQNKSAFTNALMIPRFFLELFLWKSHTNNADARRLEQNKHDYQAVMDNSYKLIQNNRIHFIFVHLPIPHPPGLYNRATHKLCACGNYLDNLVLADDTLGLLEKTIDQTPWANQTTLIVSSDHSWRIPLWRGGDDWTPEEEAVSRGRFDTRPVFLVHFPGQTAPFDIAGPTPEMTEHDIVADMLQNKINSPQDLLAFVHAQNPQSVSPSH